MTLIEADIPPRKSALAPDLRRVDERAARAWTERMAVRPLPDGRYTVDAESGATYVVDLRTRSCTCPDHQIRGEHCKHLRRVAIEITARRVPPPGKTWARCDACGTDTFAGVNDPEFHLCANCHLEPGDVVVDRESVQSTVSYRVNGVPRRATTRGLEDERRESSGETANHETGDRLVVRAVTDRRAGEMAIPSTGQTVADHPTNEGYPRDDLVVEVSYLGDLRRERTRDRRYSFPISRLEPTDDAMLVSDDQPESQWAPPN